VDWSKKLWSLPLGKICAAPIPKGIAVKPWKTARGKKPLTKALNFDFGNFFLKAFILA
jgi:hypothetical protein